MKGKIVSVNISSRKGVAKSPVDEAQFKVDHGVVGDAHAGPGIRQVSLLALEDRQWFEQNVNKETCLKDGDFGENLTTEGIAWQDVELGQRFEVGEAVLEVSKKGKECHDFCAIKRQVGECIMPERGVFAIVLKPGVVRPGDSIEML